MIEICEQRLKGEASGQITTIPTPELRSFYGSLGLTCLNSRDEICPEPSSQLQDIFNLLLLMAEILHHLGCMKP